MPEVRLGVLGWADIAERRILPAVAAVPELTLAALASRDGERARAAASRHHCAAVTGYPALLRRDDVDAVYVPVPAALHARWAEAALLVGKHVLVEKPIAQTAARARELVALARARGLVIMENVMFVHHSQHAAVRALVADGRIGDPRLLTASFLIPRGAGSHIRFRADLGGGALWEMGVYPVRAAIQFLGPDLEIAGATLTAGAGDAVNTSGAALLRSGTGVAVQLSFGIDHCYRASYELTGTAGRITVTRAFTPSADHAPELRIAAADGTETVRRLPPDDQVVNALTAFTQAVRHHGTPLPGVAETLRQTALLEELSLRAAWPAAAGNDNAAMREDKEDT